MKHNSVATLWLATLFAVCPCPLTRAHTDDSTQLAQEYLELATLYTEKSDKEKALLYYEKALEKSIGLAPVVIAEAHVKAGNLYREKNEFDPALKHYARALNHHPNNLLALMELGNSLNMLDRDEESITLYMRALELKPDLTSALHNFGFTLKKMGRYDDAIAVFRKLLEITPNYGLGHFNLAATLLTIGNFKEGWTEYEWRWQAYGETPKRFAQALWNGSDITGKRLLVYSEQGIGDTFQFIRYLELLHKKGIYLIFESQMPATEILRLCPYIDRVITRGQQLPEFDYQIPLMSLPLIMGTTIETVPQNIPYLHADQKLVDDWAQRLSADKNFKIGICWHGNAHYPTQALRRAVEAKSIPLEKMARLAKIPHVSVYSLQQVDAVDQLDSLDPSLKIIRFPADFDKKHGRFMDTAAVMKNFDLVVSIDTSIIHLAGGMDVPAFLILPNPADWRWIAGQAETPWYPKMRLFLQQNPGEWDDVIEKVIGAVQALVGDRPTKLKRHIVDPASLEKNIASILNIIIGPRPAAKNMPEQPAKAPDQAAAVTEISQSVAPPAPPPLVQQPSSQPFTDITRQKVKEGLQLYQGRFSLNS